MKVIGFMCKIRDGENPKKTLDDFHWLRLLPIFQYLKKKNIKLFIFSPYYIDFDAGTSHGYFINDEKFTPAISSIPKIIGNWYDGYQSFGRNTRNKYRLIKERLMEGGYSCYPSYDLIELSEDKMRTYDMVNKFTDVKHPKTKLLSDGKESIKSIRRFCNNHNLIFIKPRYGRQGNRIYVVKKVRNSYLVKYHVKKQVQKFEVESCEKILELIQTQSKEIEFIIQEGVNVSKYKRRSYILRVVMVNDSSKWYLFPKVTIATRSSEVANPLQDSVVRTIEDFMIENYGNKHGKVLMRNLFDASYQLTYEINNQFNNNIMEIAYDFTIDKDFNIHLIEIQMQPGMYRCGLSRGDIKDHFNINNCYLPLYDKYVRPYGTYLAQFLQAKYESLCS